MNELSSTRVVDLRDIRKASIRDRETSSHGRCGSRLLSRETVHTRRNLDPRSFLLAGMPGGSSSGLSDSRTVEVMAGSEVMRGSWSTMSSS
jgi:hypothetical protein